MITYVNTVLVANKAPEFSIKKFEAKDKNLPFEEAGQLVLQNLSQNAQKLGDGESFITEIPETADTIRIGIVTNKNVATKDPKSGRIKYTPIVKWSNAIRKHDIKSMTKMTKADGDYTFEEDTVTIDFNNVIDAVKNRWAEGGKRVILRLTFKDLPTRFRKWTESYEYVTVTGDTVEKIAEALAKVVTNEYKRARTYAEAKNGKLVLTAMPYDDDDDFDTINRADKVRFNANVYWTDPAAEGWESLNKHFPTGMSIHKDAGKTYPATGKLVRDRENQAYGYQGIINRGMCTWPIIQPERQAQDGTDYDAVTLEFENMYRAADDIFRKTKQSVEIYVPAGSMDTVAGKLAKFAGYGSAANVPEPTKKNTQSTGGSQQSTGGSQQPTGGSQQPTGGDGQETTHGQEVKPGQEDF